MLGAHEEKMTPRGGHLLFIMSKLDSYPPGFQNRALTSVYKRFVTGAHNASFTSRRTVWTLRESCTWAAGTTRSAGFVRDFISVVPFFACKAPACSHAGERNRHPQLISSTISGTSPGKAPDIH